MFVLSYNFPDHLLLLCIATSMAAVGCNSGAEKIRNADSIQIFYPVENGVLEYKDSSRSVIDYCKKVLNGKTERRHCPTEGEIRFMIRDSIIFLAGFSFKNPDCQYLMSGGKAWKLTYNAGQFLTTAYYELNKK